MNIVFARPAPPASGTWVVGVAKGGVLTTTAGEVDKVLKGAIKRAIAAADFSGKIGEHLSLAGHAGVKAQRVVLAGLGKPADLDAAAAQKIGGALAAFLAASGTRQAAITVDTLKGQAIKPEHCAANIAFGAKLRSYRFDKYRTKKREDQKAPVQKLTVMVAALAAARAAHRPLAGIADGVFLTRDLVSEPANVLTPVALAKEARSLTADGVKVEVMGEARMRKLGMGALLGVSVGSVNEAQLVVMRWDGAGTRGRGAGAPIAFVGKGVTFDTGGISIKPSGGMEDMKWDMGGAGVVIGLMRALARRKAKVNAVGIVGLVENMPSGSAQRPGDVVTSMSGQTIEVINTDAEGRLVLADAVWYAQQRFKPKLVIDLATLTGAIIVSLGHERAGLFCNNETLSKRLVDAGDAVNERLWPMPLDDVYDKDINSDIADMKNVGSNRGAGSVAAAKFIERYVDNRPWAHLDIAGVTWSKKDRDVVPRGGSAFGVRLLDRLVADHYESK